MSTIYVTLDGTATTYAVAAAAENSSQAGSLNVSDFNTQQSIFGRFQDNDVILFSASRGNLTSAVIVKQGASNEAGRITYQVDPVSIPTITNSTVALHPFLLSGNSNSIDYIDVIGLQLQQSVSSEACFGIQGDTGAAEDSSVNIIDVTCLGSPLGDDFSQKSGTGHINYLRCHAIDARADQGWTAHEIPHTAKMTDCTATGCKQGVLFVGGSEYEWIGGSMKDFDDTGFGLNFSGAASTVVGCDIDPEGNTGMFAEGAGGTTLTLTDCTTIVEGVGNLKVAGNTITVLGGTLFWNSNGKPQISVGGALTMNRSATGNLVVTIGPLFDQFSFFQTTGVNNSANSLTLDGVFFDIDGDNVRLINVDDLLGITMTGCVVFNRDATTSCIKFNALSSTSVVSNNTFYTPVGTGVQAGGIGVDSLAFGGSVVVNNNIFYNYLDAIDANAGTNFDYNNYSVNTPDAGGTGKTTADPLFVDATLGGRNFQIQEALLMGAGKPGVIAYNDHRGFEFFNPANQGAYSQFVDGLVRQDSLQGVWLAYLASKGFATGGLQSRQLAWFGQETVETGVSLPGLETAWLRQEIVVEGGTVPVVSSTNSLWSHYLTLKGFTTGGLFSRLRSFLKSET